MKKEKERLLVDFGFVYLRLRSATAATATITITTAAAAIAYIVDAGIPPGPCGVVGVGDVEVVGIVDVGVGPVVCVGFVVMIGAGEVASDTMNDVPALLPKYEFEPSNVAVTVYIPGTGGVHEIAKFPSALLVVVPMFWRFPLGSIAVR
jgi:hypothetical protein